MTALVNKVENKPIVQIDLERWLPSADAIAYFDLKDYLFQEWVLKENDFRASLESLDWEVYRNKYTVVECTNDAIIPQWAFLLVSHYLQAVESVSFSSRIQIQEQILLYKVQHVDISEYKDKRVLIKGCSSTKIGILPYMLLTQRLSEVVKAFSYGESCSMVPIFKN